MHLAESIKESDRLIWWPAVIALANLGPGAVPTLQQALADGGDQQRKIIGTLLKIVNSVTE